MLIPLTALFATLSSVFRSRSALQLENLPLRHQIGVLQRAARKRPKLTHGDDAGTQAPTVGGNTVVALEQNDGSGVDRVVMEAVTDSNGAFSFCPVASGTYDIVVAAISGGGVAYGA